MLPIHELNNIGNDHFLCSACGYETDLAGAVEHAIKKQFVYVQEEEEDEYA